MISITLILITFALLIVLPVGYFAVLKWNEHTDAKTARVVIIAIFSAVLLVVAVLGINLYSLLINHDQRVVAQRYVNSLIDNSINGDEASFLAEVETFSYEINDASGIFTTVSGLEFDKTPGLLISQSEAMDSEGNVYLYVITEDLNLCLDIELKPSGRFFDVYDVSVVDEDQKETLLVQEQFKPMW